MPTNNESDAWIASKIPHTPPAASAADHADATQWARTWIDRNPHGAGNDVNLARCYLALTAQLARAEAALRLWIDEGELHEKFGCPADDTCTCEVAAAVNAALKAKAGEG